MTADAPATPARILLLGATGSIGSSTANCVRRYPERFSLVGLAAHRSTDALMELAREFGVCDVCVVDEAQAEKASGVGEMHVRSGADGLVDLIRSVECDIVVNAIVGSAGLPPTVAALQENRTVALANKESLVVGGDLIRTMTESGNGEIVPIDSEHSAILQCLTGEDRGSVESIILTASGGPFRDLAADQFASITPEQALRHPTWAMGAKITIDSATLMNKGLEIIEAHHLFDASYDMLRVCIHPQSIIHSMVEFHDGAVMAQMGVPDMELPIQYALEYPRRLALNGARLNLAELGALTFMQPDFDRFPCLRLCIEAGRTGGAAPVVLNAANELAVHAFLNSEVPFTAIADTIEHCLESVTGTVASLEDILVVDRRARDHAQLFLDQTHRT